MWHFQNQQLWLWLKQLERLNSEDQDGITVIEVLVAMLMITFVITAITPSIFLAVATRIQITKAEQALQLATGTIEAARSRIISGSTALDDLPPKITSAPNSSVADLYDFPAPDGPCASDVNYTPENPFCPEVGDGAAKYKLVDIDRDGTNDFFVQTYRDGQPIEVAGPSPTNSITYDACVMTRVYAVEALDNIGTPELETEQASLTFTTGEGSRRRRPLAVIYSNVGAGVSNPDALPDYISVIGGNSESCH